jgi:hypothetical protein
LRAHKFLAFIDSIIHSRIPQERKFENGKWQSKKSIHLFIPPGAVQFATGAMPENSGLDPQNWKKYKGSNK